MAVINRSCAIIIFSVSVAFAFAQEIKVIPEIGAGIVANLQTTGFGLELRYRVPLYHQFSITPRICYYHSLNSIHELYAGFDIVYHFPEIRKLKFYCLAGPYFNYWFNYLKFNHEVSRLTSFGAEPGLGVEQKIGVLSPYLEGRYNTRWKEGTLIIGLKIILQKRKWDKKAVKCQDI